jgi:hypothetical protein
MSLSKGFSGALQRVGLIGYKFMNWWTTPDVIFALKYAAASIVQSSYGAKRLQQTAREAGYDPLRRYKEG